MNKNYKILFTFLLLFFSVVFFYFVWATMNYGKHIEIKQNLVNHPEFIPSKKTVDITASGFDNIVADFYWLTSIQYIWSNALSSEYKKYLFQMLQLITDLNPTFSYPYQIWELLLSNYNERYETISKKDQINYDKKALEIWLKWIKNTCDTKKIDLIKKEQNLSQVWLNPKYSNPCLDSNIPYYLAYLYYWNFKDWKSASQYYKITAANKDAPTWSRIMAAIMEGKSWNRQKAILMFLSIAASLQNDKSMNCNKFTQDLRNLLIKAFENNQNLNSQFIIWVENFRKEIVKQIEDNNKDESVFNEYSCTNYLNKAVRELNLAFIEKADKSFFEKNKINATDAKELFDNWFIDYLPLDYQQEKDYWIIYYFNSEYWYWDYKMWKYWEIY